MQFIGTVNNNIFNPRDPISYGIFLHKLNGKKVVCDIKQKRKPTTDEQYGYLFGDEGVFAAIAEQTGHTKLEVEFHYKMKFHFKIVDWNGIAVRMPDSISREKYDRPRLSKLIENIRMDSAQDGWWTPEPRNG